MALDLMAGQVGLAYSYQMKFPANATQTWSVTAGSLPAGLTLNAAGLISGTPTTEQEATFTVTVVSGIPSTTSQEFLIRIFNPPVAVDATQSTYAKGQLTGNSQFHFQRHGAWYLMAGYGGNETNIRIYKSSNGGLTWAALDTANEPPRPTGGVFVQPVVMGQFWDGADTIYCCYISDWTYSGTSLGTPATIRLKKFSLLTDTWQPAFGGTTTILLNQQNTVAMALLTTGVIRIFFADGATGAIGEPLSLYYTDNNGSTFTARTLLETPGGAAIRGNCVLEVASLTHQSVSFTGGGTVDVCHLWYMTNGGGNKGRWYIRVDAAGTPSALFAVPSGDYIVDGSGGEDFNGNALFESASDSLVQPFQGRIGTDRAPAVYRGTPLSSPVWTKEYILPANPLDQMNRTVLANYVSLFRAADGREACIFAGCHIPGTAEQFTSYFICYYDPAHPELKWTVREEFYSEFTNPTPGIEINFDPLDELPFWAEATPGGGFYFGFIADVQDRGNPMNPTGIFVFISPGAQAGPSAPSNVSY